MRGVTLYIGTTGTGKTHAALEDLRALEGFPRVLIDLGGSSLLATVPLHPVGDGTKALPEESRFTPETGEELEAALVALYRRGNVAVLVDDSAALPCSELQKLCRLWRPRNLRIALTTQHISGDVAQAVQACDPLIFAFRTTSTASLEWLRKWHGVDPDELRGLQLGEALELSF